MRGRDVVLVKLMAMAVLTCALFLATGCSGTGRGWHESFDGVESDRGPDEKVRLYDELDQLTGRNA